MLERSTIRVRLDSTNQHISYTLQLKLVEAFQSFMKQLVKCVFTVIATFIFKWTCPMNLSKEVDYGGYEFFPNAIFPPKF